MTAAQEGQLVQLLGKDRKSFIIRLCPGQRLQTHRGILVHDDLIGQPLGGQVSSHLGHRYYLLTPSWDELLRSIRRNSQIVYPKEIGYILMKMSIRPGSVVIDAGTGSGALAAGLASAVMPNGRVISYELREDMHNLARRNLAHLGLDAYVTLKRGDIAEGFDETEVDALFLDVPNPWHYLEHAHAALRGSGFFGAILPTTNQVIALLHGLERSPFAFVEVEEILVRGYKTVPARFRPDDRMVAHTGYLIFARALVPEPAAPEEEE